ncbi:cytochrome P450 2D20, partial [Biomphalaria glabrata]
MKGVLGKVGIGQCNCNGLLLLQTCAEHKLLMSNTIFSLPMRKPTSWMHPRSRHWPLIDYVITRQSDRQDIRVNKSCCVAKCGPDHHLIITKLNIRIQPKRRPQKSNPLKRLNTARLADDKIEKSLADAIENCFKSTPLAESNVDKSWECFKEAIHSTALSILGPSERKHQNWFDENSTEIRKLLDEKHKLHKLYLNNPNSQSTKDAFTNISKNVQKQLRQMQDTWLSKKLETIQEFADKHDMKNFFHSINE